MVLHCYTVIPTSLSVWLALPLMAVISLAPRQIGDYDTDHTAEGYWGIREIVFIVNSSEDEENPACWFMFCLCFLSSKIWINADVVTGEDETARLSIITARKEDVAGLLPNKLFFAGWLGQRDFCRDLSMTINLHYTIWILSCWGVFTEITKYQSSKCSVPPSSLQQATDL